MEPPDDPGIALQRAGHDRPRPGSGRRFAALDGLRGIAALMVFVTHAPVRVEGLVAFQDGMRAGVVVFFALSGFLIFRAFAVAWDGRECPVDLRAYAVRRLLRIFPAYIVATLALSVLTGDRDALADPLGQLLMLETPIAVVWSLRVELVFYALLPVIGWALRGLSAPRRVEALLLVGLASFGTLVGLTLLLMSGETIGPPPYMEWIGAFWQFIPGMLVAAALVQSPARSATMGRLPIAALGLAALLVGASLNLGPYDLPSAVGAGLLIAFIVARPEPGRRLSAACAVAGGMSYAFYLWHHQVLALLGALDPVAATGVAFVLTAAISLASWRLVERPMIAVSHRLTRPSAASRPVAQPQPSVAPTG